VAKGGYQWTLDGPLPLIEDHSRAKHDVLRAYLVNYLRILAQSPRSSGVKVTLVDGFAGGGQYRSRNGALVPGSPLILFDALREARALVLQDRAERGFQGSYVIRAHVHLVEPDRGANEYLTRLLRDSAGLIDANTSYQIHLGTFEAALETILTDIRSRQRGGRSVFILDQYGWSQVRLPLIHSIFQKLPSAEVFLTWMIDSLINFISEQTVDKLNPALAKAGFAQYLGAEQLLAMKREKADDDLTWRRAIQTLLAGEIRSTSGAAYCTPFYIVPRNSRRGYWLLHLAQHLRANEEMKRIHWSNNNLHHPGGPGLNMLGYIGTGGQLGFDHRFDDRANDVTHNALVEDLPRRISEQHAPIRFGDLVALTANETPAQRAQIQDAVFWLAQRKQLSVTTLSGSTRRGARGLADDDVIEFPSQLWLLPGRA